MPRQVILAGDVIECRSYAWQPDLKQLGINTTKWQVAGPITGPSTLDSVASALGSQIRLLIPPLMSSAATLYGVSVRALKGATRETPAWYRNPTPGTVSGEILPAQLTGLVSMYTAYAGRQGRGRNYLPFPADSSNDDGVPTSGYHDVLTAYALFLSEPLVTSTDVEFTLIPGLFPLLAGDPPARGFVPFVETTASIYWATQRRRGEFGRVNTLPRQLQ